MTACDATLVIVQEDGGVYKALLALSPLMAVPVCEGAVPYMQPAWHVPDLGCLDSGCSSFDGSTQGRDASGEGRGEAGQC